MSSGDGCARRTMRSMSSWGRAASIATSGRRGGGLGGRTEGVVEGAVCNTETVFAFGVFAAA